MKEKKKENKIFNFKRPQVYIDRKEIQDALLEDFKRTGLTNQNEYLRNIIVKGLEVSIGKSLVGVRKVDIDQLSFVLVSKLEELTKTINNNKNCANDFIALSNEQLLNTIKEIQKTQELLLRAITHIYCFTYAETFKMKIKEKDFHEGICDSFPEEFLLSKQRGANNE